MSNEIKENKRGIRLLTLSDCDYCMWLKSELTGCGIAYVNIDADEFSEFADLIERKFKTYTYPIIFIDLGDKVITIVGETELDTSDTLRTFNNIPELVNIIKQYNNEI